MSVLSLPRIGPYMGVSRDTVKKYSNGKKLRFIVYGAYNAMGLIGSECNGIAVLDENEKAVLCDEICSIDSGYFGPSAAQLALYDNILSWRWPKVREYLNAQVRSRYAI